MAGKQDSPTAAVVVDPDGVVSGWSEAGRLLLGWTAQDTVGRSVTDLLADPPPAGFPGGHGTGPDPDPTEFIRLRHRNGSTVDAVVAAHPLSGSDGRTLGHVVTVQRWGRRPVIADRAFEATELELPEGSLLALYTDGLVGGRERGADEGVSELLRVLTRAATSLEAVCDRAMETVLPDDRTDDAALLLARTHALAAHHVADWDVEPDTAQVPHARKFAVDQVEAWGLQEAAFVTELVVSELVTNAIRYGEPPIRLRLIRDTSLICEVSDASDTAPHLRRARAFDEGGRGLLLVAHLTQGWGTRHSTNGKTIWCAQTL
ncbi:SpoIIE family protein phosphatase [Streptomyces hawaiiensis]|uniref:SpoIIE family protein phosphatase n=1 Tax=Streptomyces hawaiiensis TaxID=67305 RepID=UPI003669291F